MAVPKRSDENLDKSDTLPLLLHIFNVNIFLINIIDELIIRIINQKVLN